MEEVIVKRMGKSELRSKKIKIRSQRARMRDSELTRVFFGVGGRLFGGRWREERGEGGWGRHGGRAWGVERAGLDAGGVVEDLLGEADALLGSKALLLGLHVFIFRVF